MLNFLKQNIKTLKQIYFTKTGNEARKALKEIFGKCSIRLAKDTNGVTVITLENGDRVFLDPESVELKPNGLFNYGSAILYSEV